MKPAAPLFAMGSPQPMDYILELAQDFLGAYFPGIYASSWSWNGNVFGILGECVKTTPLSHYTGFCKNWSKEVT